MEDIEEMHGQCLCGATRLVARSVKKNIGACHCTMCRKWGGGPLMAVDCGTDISITGEDTVSVFVSSDWAERGFCNRCGTHLFYRLKGTQQHIVPAGLFDDADDAFAFEHQVFVDERPPYYSFANKTEEMTGAELFAQFANT